jgi:hypothetical protein
MSNEKRITGLRHPDRIRRQTILYKSILCLLVLFCLTTASCLKPSPDKATTSPATNGTLTPRQNKAPIPGGPYQHKILSATSTDGINWTTDPGVRIEHASVPCAIKDDSRIIIYYVDADRGPGQPESVTCAVTTDGINFSKQPFKIDGMTTLKALDPSIVRDDSGRYLLYYLASNVSGDPAAEKTDHQIHLAVGEDGINFRYERSVFTYPGLVDPDVFFFNGQWFMYVPTTNGTIVIAVSTDGMSFNYLQPFSWKNWATEAPVKLENGSLRLYAFQEGKPFGNTVHSFISINGIDWIEEPGDRITASNNQKITSPSVVRWGEGYKMFYKIEDVNIRNGTAPRTPVALPINGAGPWNNDVLVFRIDSDGGVTKISTFERAGVPSIARMKDGQLIAAHQYFPANDAENFDKVAVRFSSNEGNTWTDPRVVRLSGFPQGMRFPFDPSLLVLPDGNIRLYFTSLQGRQFDNDTPAIYSAISSNGIDYTWEPGTRFSIQGRYVIDSTVVLHQGIFHLFSPDNGNPPVLSPNIGTGYHAISSDGLNFTRGDYVKIDGNRNWLGSAQSDGKIITFWGTNQNIDQPNKNNTQPKGGLWLASSPDGNVWKSIEIPSITGADPGAVTARGGGWILVATGPPRPGIVPAQDSPSRPANSAPARP